MNKKGAKKNKQILSKSETVYEGEVPDHVKQEFLKNAEQFGKVPAGLMENFFENVKKSGKKDSPEKAMKDFFRVSKQLNLKDPDDMMKEFFKNYEKSEVQEIPKTNRRTKKNAPKVTKEILHKTVDVYEGEAPDHVNKEFFKKMEMQGKSEFPKDLTEEFLKSMGKTASRTDESVRDSMDARSSIHDSVLWPEGEHITPEHSVRIPATLSRTSFHLQDYREFKAARTIQRFFRGWFVRRKLEKATHAAKVIQRTWRGFYACRVYFHKLEEMVQKRIEEHFNRAAQKIQALWRGFWVRENVHDQYRKKRMQMRAAEDLLHCVAFKLHHLLRTNQIPGIYSLRNSNCLSKVEQLLYAMQFKQYNDKVRKLRAQRETVINQAKQRHANSAFASEVPYAGPNFEGLCEPKCCELFKDIDADAKMFKILSLYENASRADKRLDRFKRRHPPEANNYGKYNKYNKRGDFCGDVIKSMRKWNILAPNKVQVDKDVFKNPENVEKFLHEIQSNECIIKPRCHCHINVEKLFEHSVNENDRSV